MRQLLGRLAKQFRTEPPIDDAISGFRQFYKHRVDHYAEILSEMPAEDDGYAAWYRTGGYNYDPKDSRIWLLTETSLPQYRGTCLDVGSGDGYWSWLLSEWFHVTGIEPSADSVALAVAVKHRLHPNTQNRVDFIVGDALCVSDSYDVIFCRAPSFFNYPIFKPFDWRILDADRARLSNVLRSRLGIDEAERALLAYPAFAGHPSDGVHHYADKWRSHLEKILAVTNKMFVFILSTEKNHYGLYVGDTYSHDPEEVAKLFSEFGRSNVRLDSAERYIVGEIYK